MQKEKCKRQKGGEGTTDGGGGRRWAGVGANGVDHVPRPGRVGAVYLARWLDVSGSEAVIPSGSQPEGASYARDQDRWSRPEGSDAFTELGPACSSPHARRFPCTYMIGTALPLLYCWQGHPYSTMKDESTNSVAARAAMAAKISSLTLEYRHSLTPMRAFAWR